MVLALKLITAGVSYQDGLKKPEVPRLCLHTALQHSHAHLMCPCKMGVGATYNCLGQCVLAHHVDLSAHRANRHCVHCRSCRHISSGTG